MEITTAPRAQLTLAVVDEGILQLKNYQTPDPHAYFYQKRALEVAAFDVYPFLLPELGTSSSSGGDAADMRRRTNPVPNRRVKLVANWSGRLTADADGKMRYQVRVPQFSGTLRIMAVAYKDDAFGSAEATMKVADPVVHPLAQHPGKRLRPAGPRQNSPPECPQHRHRRPHYRRQTGRQFRWQRPDATQREHPHGR